MHHGCRKDPFASAMTQIYKVATRNVKGIMPALVVLVLPCLLNPLEHLEERLEFYFAVGQGDLIETASIPFHPTFYFSLLN